MITNISSLIFQLPLYMPDYILSTIDSFIHLFLSQQIRQMFIM